MTKANSIEVMIEVVTCKIELPILKRVLKALINANQNAEALQDKVSIVDRVGQTIHKMYDVDMRETAALIEKLEDRGVKIDN